MNETIKRLIIIYFCGVALICLGYIATHIVTSLIVYTIGWVLGLLCRKEI